MGAWARRPALDGLRAVALVMVLLFHGGVAAVGGSIGMDIFLVLSGYLITGMLLVELENDGRIDLRAFWARRARRLLPAALVLIVGVSVLWRPDPLEAVAALGWWSNWRFALSDTGYFESFGEPSMLRHTWSLAVEEQWYLLWPLLLLALHRWRFRLAATVTLALGSAGVMWWLAADVDRVHMGTDTRAQGLLVGAATAMVLHGRRVEDLSRGVTTAAGLAGAAFLGWITWRVPGAEPWLYHGGHLLAAVASAAVVAAAVRPTGPVRTVLAIRPLRALGLVSYGAYLWHWPLFVWLNPERLALDPWPLFGVRCAATAAATLLSWRFVEAPIREGRPIPRPHLAVPAAFAAALAVVVAAAAFEPARRADAVAEAASELRPPPGFVAEATAAVVAPPGVLDRPPEARPIVGDPKVTVVGDSTGFGLGFVDPVDGVDVHTGASIGCGLNPADFVIGATVRHEPGLPVPCADALDLWRWWAAADDPDLVILAAGAWELYDRQLDDGTRLELGTAPWREWVADDLERAAEALAAAAPHALIGVVDVPCFAERDLSLGGANSPRNDPARQAVVNEVFAEVVARHPERMLIVPWTQWLCGSDAFQRYDGVHLDPIVARQLWLGPLGAWVRTTLGAE